MGIFVRFSVLFCLIAVLGVLIAAQSFAQTSVPVLSSFLSGQDRSVSKEEPLDRRQSTGFFENDRRRGGMRSDVSRVKRGSGAAEQHDNYRRRAVVPVFSPLELLYSRRIVDELSQYGYDLFGVPSAETQDILESVAGQVPAMPTGAVQDHFILHIGDELEIVFSGQRADRNLVKINSEGVLLIEDFPPIPAAGRSIGQVRISIEAAAANLYNTQAYLSLASVRQIGVLVAGHVKRPGRQSLTVFHTVLDALMEAGGVEKAGSLRQIKLVRHGRSTLIDLYSLLMHGAAHVDLQLRDGDRIIVPPVGPSVAIAGEVKRPGIYEILPRLAGMHHQPGKRSEKLSLNDMLDFAAGVLVPGDNRLMKLSLTEDGRETVEEAPEDAFKLFFGDGDILMVAKGLEKRTDTVELLGHTRKPGIYALEEKTVLSEILKGEQVLGTDIYPLIGVIERWNPEQLTNILLDFPLKLVISGDYDRRMRDGDIVHLFSKTQIARLEKKISDKNMERDIASSQLSQPLSELEQGSLMEMPEEMATWITDPVMVSFLTERSAFIRGAVRKPGAYPVADGVTLDSLLAVAGGLSLEANTGNIEITSASHGQNAQAHGRSGTHRTQIDFRETGPELVEISAGDAVRVNQKYRKVEDQSVLIIGEVSNPGRYDLAAGDTMSDLLERAGGLSRYAYPDGTIFSRRSERLAEEQRFRAAARDLKRAIAVALEKDDRGPNPEQVAQAQNLIAELEHIQSVGRITVESDPTVLKVEPELDILLEPGDRVFIPKRPLTVRVAGEVLSPASLQFREGRKPREYIDQAGGFTFNADKDRAFVLFPDGSAQPLSVSVWNHRATFIPPGSTIVVPRDPEPFDFIQSAKDISQVLANLAITGVFIDDVRSD